MAKELPLNIIHTTIMLKLQSNHKQNKKQVMYKQFLGDRVEMFKQIHLLCLQDIKQPPVTSSGSIGIFEFF